MKTLTMKTGMTVVIAAVLGVGVVGCGDTDAGSPDQVRIARAPAPSPTPHVGASCAWGNSARCADAATAHARGERVLPKVAPPTVVAPDRSARARSCIIDCSR